MAVTPPRFDDFLHHSALSTRWMDNDAYGHVNNVVYYSWFDTLVNAYLVEAGDLDIANGDVIGLVIESHCNYFRSLAFPEPVRGGLRVAHLGRSSVRYEIGIFDANNTDACAAGHFVHVYVDRKTRRPSALPERLRTALARIHVARPS
jgi:acyl-CoA thioester hydrolase